MDETDSEIIEKTLDLIVRVVVEVEGKYLFLGDLTERKETYRFRTVEEAELAAEDNRKSARDFYRPKVINNMPEMKRLIEEQSKLDQV